MAVKYLENSDADTLVVVFSAFQSSLKKKSDNFSFTFYNLLIPYTSYSYLFIGDESNSWYTSNVQGLSSTNIDDLFLFIKSKATGYQKVVLIGASMGAYAALYGVKYSWVTRAIVFQPQVFIKKGWPRYPVKRSLNVPDLTSDCNNYANVFYNKIVYLVGEYCLFDQYQAWSLLGNNSLKRTIIVKKSYHNVCVVLQKAGILQDLILYALKNDKCSSSSEIFSKISIDYALQSTILSETFMTNISKYYKSK